jgi:hypothetical protein
VSPNCFFTSVDASLLTEFDPFCPASPTPHPFPPSSSVNGERSPALGDVVGGPRSGPPESGGGRPPPAAEASSPALRAYLDPDCPDARHREVSSTRSWRSRSGLHGSRTLGGHPMPADDGGLRLTIRGGQELVG